MLARLSRLLTVGVLAGVLAVGSSLTAQEPTLSKEQMRQFLLTAEIVDSAPIGTGCDAALAPDAERWNDHPRRRLPVRR